MENENSKVEPLIHENEKSVKGSAHKNKRASVLKQLDNKKLYPIQERIGIYVIAILSTIGLILIGYTGVMAIASNVPETTEDLAVDAEEVHDMLDDIDLEDPVEEDVPEEDFEPTHEYVEPEEDEEVEPEPDEQEEAPEPEPETEDTVATPAPTTATINDDLVSLRRDVGSEDLMLNLNTGYVVDIIDFDSNPYWVHVTYASPDFGILEGFVAREFLDTN